MAWPGASRAPAQPATCGPGKDQRRAERPVRRPRGFGWTMRQRSAASGRQVYIEGVRSIEVALTIRERLRQLSHRSETLQLRGSVSLLDHALLPFTTTLTMVLAQGAPRNPRTSASSARAVGAPAGVRRTVRSSGAYEGASQFGNTPEAHELRRLVRLLRHVVPARPRWLPIALARHLPRRKSKSPCERLICRQGGSAAQRLRWLGSSRG